MSLDLYTDASWHEVAQVGTWAFHAVAGGVHVERYGRCPPYVATPTHAELAAILAGLWTVRKLIPSNGEPVDLYTDSLHAVQFLKGEGVGDAIEQLLVAKIRRVGIACAPTWIPSHQHGASGQRAALNNRCDYLARRTLAECLKEAGFNLPSRKDIIRAMSPPALVEIHHRVREALARRFGGNARGLNESRRWAWEVLGLHGGGRARRVHVLTLEQAQTVLTALEVAA